MTPSGPDDPERRLRSLRERQAEAAAAGHGDGATLRTLAREIAAEAGRLGFDPEEAAAIAAQIDAPAPGPGHDMAGEYRVLRGAAEPILTFSALVIAGTVIGLGQPMIGALIVAAAVASWVIRSTLRVARLRIDAAGAPGFPGRLDLIEPAELLGVEFAWRYPPWIAEHRKAASETIDLRLRLTGGRTVKLARGPLWRISPRREPVAYHRLERRLSAWAHEAGLKIERGEAGWTARRP
ncbi:hypothetical protein [Brevundimonas sp. LjRoot202]|uniref:hypothetical protein n=1 Tax=Brevundimonas sp. LjRoot202 TaxID=3342281 RepID=UPI003ECF78ED